MRHNISMFLLTFPASRKTHILVHWRQIRRIGTFAQRFSASAARALQAATTSRF